VSLADLVNINVSTQTTTPTRPGFGVPMILAQKVPAAFTARTRLFGSLAEMISYGFAATDPAYLCAQSMQAQNPSLTSWVIGKRLNQATQIFTLTCTSAVAGDTYAITVGGVTYTRVVPGSSTTTAEATALAALINASAFVTATSAAAVITVTNRVVGALVDVTAWTTSNLQLKNTTTDPGLAADLAAIKAANSIDYYGLLLDSNSQAEVVAAALFAETEKKLFAYDSSDWGCGDSGTVNDVFSTLKTSAYVRSIGLWSKGRVLSYGAAAWMAKQFAGAAPGSDTWAFKTLAGVAADTLSASERSTVLGKNANVYETTSGVNITEFGVSASGEYADITRFVDWQRADIQFRIYSAFINNSKIPFTDVGIDAMTSLIKSSLLAGVDAGGIVPGSIIITAPKAATISNKSTRKLSGVTFRATLQGAIHQLDITGTLTS
jgi:hypothetical protein